ncbi:Uncharacterized protein BP5553_05111 [Venustampulla echinocandica]|uniref:F-box domain-containing protein n=1 Tax=Venustampulla echinocandica TaxID=2656787 RepID=A0A370TQ90_9HELO|nr:Uncharacterized protein BP5553_05111 [Venustampulla echinocandica]RDL37678.1 Uncharacterized protein BP5553_05111 [Venustampulla echinocandica]
MPRSFLSLPREVRDQIYAELLTCCANVATFSPSAIEVTRSMTILRTCKQVQRECKETIWRNNNLRLHEPTEIFTKLRAMVEVDALRQVQHVKVCLELLDRDELEWVCSGLRAFSTLPTSPALRSITLIAINDRPQNMKEIKEVLELLRRGAWVDGRLFGGFPSDDGAQLMIQTAWPHFLHWGRQRWLRETLLDRGDTADLLQELQSMFGGSLYIDGVIQSKAEKLDPRDGEITIILP